MPRKKVFFTGFPGFIGRRLAKEILRKDDRKEIDFVFLVEGRFVPDAEREVERLRGAEESKHSSMEVLRGDVSREMFGLNEEKYGHLLQTVTDVFHLAAVYDLAVPKEIAKRVNVGGTRNVVSFCKNVKGLNTFVYFSTCYVAGTRTGTILEDELEMGQKFKNHYEETKFEAEVIVRESMKEIPTIIIRPGITVGDSKTGETQKFDGPYFAMILIDTLKVLQLPLPYLGDSEAEVNLVPVDFVVEATVAIWQKPAAAGKCYALADPNPLLAKTIYAELVKLLGARGPLGKIPPQLLSYLLMLPVARKLLGVPREVVDYFNYNAHFDTKNATEALEGTGLKCPHILDYLPVLVEFYKNNKHREELRWKAH